MIFKIYLFPILYLRRRQWHPTPDSCLENPMDRGAWWAAVYGVAQSQTWLSDFTFTIHFHALQKEMATHSSIPAWRIPGTGEPGGLPSMGSHRVGHDWSDWAAAAYCIFIASVSFPSFWQVVATLWCSVHTSHCVGFSCLVAQALEHAGFSSFTSCALDLWLRNWDLRA